MKTCFFGVKEQEHHASLRIEFDLTFFEPSFSLKFMLAQLSMNSCDFDFKVYCFENKNN